MLIQFCPYTLGQWHSFVLHHSGFNLNIWTDFSFNLQKEKRNFHQLLKGLKGDYGNKQEINLFLMINPSSLKLIDVTKCFLPQAEGGCSQGRLGSWIISRFFALRKSWIVFAVCFGLLSICTVKQRPLFFFTAFGWIWASSEFLLLLAAVNSQEKTLVTQLHWQAHMPAEPPPCLTDNVICFRSWCVFFPSPYCFPPTISHHVVSSVQSLFLDETLYSNFRRRLFYSDMPLSVLKVMIFITEERICSHLLQSSSVSSIFAILGFFFLCFFFSKFIFIQSLASASLWISFWELQNVRLGINSEMKWQQQASPVYETPCQSIVPSL